MGFGVMGKAGRRDIGKLWISRVVLVIGKLCSMEWNGGEHISGTHIPFTNPTAELASHKQNKFLLSHPRMTPLRIRSPCKSIRSTLVNLVRPTIFSPLSSLAQISASTAAGIHLDCKQVAPWRSQSTSFPPFPRPQSSPSSSLVQ